MSPGAIALTTIFGIVAVGAAIGFLAGMRRKMDLEQWTVGGRSFGLILMYLLMAGEVYTSFSFLGASGWAYSRGGPTLYILAYMPLAYVISFFILPHLWEAGARYRLQTQPDFFMARYRSKYLAGFVSIIGVLCLLPYFQLQITGLGIIVSVASFGAIGRTPAMVISVCLMTGFVLAGGIRAVAWVSVLKDALMLTVALAIGFGIPYIYFGGIGPMFTALIRAHPTLLTMPGSTTNLGHTWYVSTVLLSAFGGFMWPHAFATSFTARSAETLRRNAVFMPVYQITVVLLLCVGFTAILVVPGLPNGDLALLTVVRKSLPAWLLGLVGGAGALTAMVPAAIIVLTAATLFARNLWRGIFAPAMTDAAVGRLARVMVVLLSLVSLWLAVYSSATLVSLLLIGFAGVAQFFPGVALGLYWGRASAAAVMAGLVAGTVTTACLIISHRDPLYGWNAGFLGLCLNFLIAIGVSVLTPRTSVPEPEEFSVSPL